MSDSSLAGAASFLGSSGTNPNSGVRLKSSGGGADLADATIFPMSPRNRVAGKLDIEKQEKHYIYSEKLGFRYRLNND